MRTLQDNFGSVIEEVDGKGGSTAGVCVAVCCSVLQCVAVCCSVLQCVVAYCSMMQCDVVYCSVL